MNVFFRNLGTLYREWVEHFPEYELSVIVYPGRSTRLNEKSLTTMKEYITQLNEELVPCITKSCIFIGHRYMV